MNGFFKVEFFVELKQKWIKGRHKDVGLNKMAELSLKAQIAEFMRNEILSVFYRPRKKRHMTRFDGLFVSNGSVFTEHKSGPNTEPCATPLLIFAAVNLAMSSLMQDIQTTCVAAHKEVFALVSRLIQPPLQPDWRGRHPNASIPWWKLLDILMLPTPKTAALHSSVSPQESCWGSGNLFTMV